MVSYFMKRYAMSEKGAINLKKAIISHTFVNLTKLFAPMIAFMFLFQYIGVLKGIGSYNFTLFHYLILIIVMMILMFLVARWDYVRLYTNVYNESANSRIDLASSSVFCASTFAVCLQLPVALKYIIIIYTSVTYSFKSFLTVPAVRIVISLPTASLAVFAHQLVFR